MDAKDDAGLASVGVGCEELVVVSHDDEKGCETLRMRSGDAVYLAGRSRFTGHGVARILPGTCPRWLEEWSTEREDCGFWQGWMTGKRVALQVRQKVKAGHESLGVCDG